MKILGISAYYHDAAATLLVDGRLVAAAQEERFTRIKHDPAFPKNAIAFCLSFAGIVLDDLDAIVFYDKPFLKFERLLETYCSFAPAGLRSFLTSIPLWIKEKLFLKKLLLDELSELQPFNKKKALLLFPEHHLSHAASAFFPSPFREAAILTMDGVGEWATASISKGEGNQLTVLKELHFPHSPGLLYSAFTYYCGFKVNSGEYKLMGLAPYGDKDSAAFKQIVSQIRTRLVSIKDDGSIFLNQEYFTFATSLRMVRDDSWEQLFGIKRRLPESPLEQIYCDMALAIQGVMEEIVIGMAKEARRITGSHNLCMAGGVALNCVANEQLNKAGIFSAIFIQPAAGDAGGSLGAAYAAHHIYFQQPAIPITAGSDSMRGALLGPEYTDVAVATALNIYDPVYTKYNDFSTTAAVTADLLAGGNIIGWFQGRMEFGPRALGARSILADPRLENMQQRINLQVKFRESFRPFAPVVLEESAADYFDEAVSSPYMLFVKTLKKSRQLPHPAGYETFSLPDKLNAVRSDIPAVTHVDYSARVQTVRSENHPLLGALLSAFEKRTGCAVLINTSFNVRGEPIVNTPVDAYRCFMESGLDYLVMGNLVFDKRLQPKWQHDSRMAQPGKD